MLFSLVLLVDSAWGNVEHLSADAFNEFVGNNELVVVLFSKYRCISFIAFADSSI